MMTSEQKNTCTNNTRCLPSGRMIATVVLLLKYINKRVDWFFFLSWQTRFERMLCPQLIARLLLTAFLQAEDRPTFKGLKSGWLDGWLVINV